MYKQVSLSFISLFFKSLFLSVFIFLTACGGSGGNGNSTSTLTDQTLVFEQEGELVRVINTDAQPFSNTLNGVRSSGILTYMSSNLDVATVDHNGMITVVGEGETTITARSDGDARYNSASANFLLRVLPREPLNQPELSARTDIKTITLEWDQVADAHHYNVYPCTENCEKLPLDIRAEVNPNTIEIDQYIDAMTNAKPQTYRVQACDEEEIVCSEWSEAVTVSGEALTGYIKAPIEYVHIDAIFGADVAISSNGIMAISAPDEVINEAENINGAVYIYDNHDDGSWQFKTRIVNSLPESDFGLSLDMDLLGNRLVVSGIASNENTVEIMAHVYDRNNDGSWGRPETLTVDTQGSISGRSSNVAISNSNTIIMSTGWGNGTVAVYQYSQEQGWEQEWLRQGGAGFDALTFTTIAVDPSGDTFAFALDNDEELNVEVFTRDNNGEWQSEYDFVRTVYTLNQSDIALADGGNLLAVSASTEVRMDGEETIDRVGAVHLYRRGDGGWGPAGTIQPDLPKDTRFGFELAVAGEGRHIVVGSDDPRLEHPVFMFQLNDAQQWVAVEGGNISTRRTTDGDFLDRYGRSIDISVDGRDMVVGAYHDDDLVAQPVTPLADQNVEGQRILSGAAYLF